jgi:exonuclease III
MAICTNVRFMTWNVQGVDKNLLQDPLFNYCLDNNDVIVLTETWLSDRCNIRDNEFYVYHCLRPQNSNAWRPSGGICVLVRNNLRLNNRTKAKGITIMRENEYSIWLKMSREFFTMESDIFIGGIYITPENSTFYNKMSHTNPFQELENDISSFSTDGNIILLGDFNSRTGVIKDFLNSQPITDVSDPLDMNTISILEQARRSTRNSSDLSVNNFGKNLIQLCINTDIRILNGRSIGDLLGCYTSHQYNGKSVVDYILVSENLIPYANNLVVSSPNHLSDHCYVNAIIDIPQREKIQINPKSQGPKNPFNKLKWDLDSGLRYQCAINSPHISKLISNFLTRNFESDSSPSESCNELNNIILMAGNMSLRKKFNGHNVRRRPNKLGFDGECRLLKNAVLHAGKLVKKFPNDPIIYGSFISKKKQFKSHVKQKKSPNA